MKDTEPGTKAIILFERRSTGAFTRIILDQKVFSEKAVCTVDLGRYDRDLFAAVGGLNRRERYGHIPRRFVGVHDILIGQPAVAPLGKAVVIAQIIGHLVVSHNHIGITLIVRIIILRAENMTELVLKDIDAALEERIGIDLFTADLHVALIADMRPPCRAPSGFRSRKIETNDIEISVAVAVIIIQLDLRMKVVERLIYQIVDGTLGIIVIVIAIAFCIIGKDLITMQMELSVGRRLIKAVHTL